MKLSQTDVGKIAERIVFEVSHAAAHETIVCAAVRASGGKIVIGHRHVDAIRSLQEMQGYENEEPASDNQGFVTSTGRFVSRKQAYRLHFPNRTKPDELQSDDLY
jgi:hypothetical protein